MKFSQIAVDIFGIIVLYLCYITNDITWGEPMNRIRRERLKDYIELQKIVSIRQLQDLPEFVLKEISNSTL